MRRGRAKERGADGEGYEAGVKEERRRRDGPCPCATGRRDAHARCCVPPRGRFSRRCGDWRGYGQALPHGLPVSGMGLMNAAAFHGRRWKEGRAGTGRRDAGNGEGMRRRPGRIRPLRRRKEEASLQPGRAGLIRGSFRGVRVSVPSFLLLLLLPSFFSLSPAFCGQGRGVLSRYIQFRCFGVLPCPPSGTSLFLNASKQECGGLTFPTHWACCYYSGLLPLLSLSSLFGWGRKNHFSDGVHGKTPKKRGLLECPHPRGVWT